MLKNEPYNYDPSVEPAPRFATDAQIELAQQLRHRLEERYLGSSAVPSPLKVRSGDVH